MQICSESQQQTGRTKVFLYKLTRFGLFSLFSYSINTAAQFSVFSRNPVFPAKKSLKKSNTLGFFCFFQAYTDETFNEQKEEIQTKKKKKGADGLKKKKRIRKKPNHQTKTKLQTKKIRKTSKTVKIQFTNQQQMSSLSTIHYRTVTGWTASREECRKAMSERVEEVRASRNKGGSVWSQGGRRRAVWK